MRKRRAEQPAAGAMSAADSAADSVAGVAAGAASRAMSADAALERQLALEDQQNEAEPQLQMIGQELAPFTEVSQVSVTPEPSRKAKSGNKASSKNTPSRATPGAVTGEGFQTPSVQVQSLENGVETPKSNRNELESGGKDEKESLDVVVPNGPVGQPMSLGPPNGMQQLVATPQPALPLFTPEQIDSWNRLEMRAPILGARPGMRLGGVQDLPGSLALPPPGYDPGIQEWQEQRNRELLWKAQMEANMETMMLQLRASHAENLRLKTELTKANERRGSSSYATPEDKEGGSLEGRKEDGADARQAKRKAILDAQEELLRGYRWAQQIEDGLVGQQVKEDGRSCQQVKEDGRSCQQAKEDGQVCQQAKEDGLGSQQEEEDSLEEEGSSSSESEELQPAPEVPQSSKERQGGKRRKSSKEEGTLAVMLQLMKGMQSMQEKMLDQGFGQGHRGNGTEEEETVRVHADLHVLPERSADSAPVDFSDWLLLVSSQMSDLSSTSSVWWDLVVEESRTWYRKHQTLKPLEKLRHLTKPSVDLQATKWKRLEKRASTLLLKAIPEQQKEDLVASKDISVMNILCRLMLCYQPGGSQEKQAVLSALESPCEANSISEAITGLKKWLRWKKRSEEVGVQLPDCTVLLRGLDRLMGKVLQTNGILNFRLNLSRTTLMVDAVPTMQAVEQYAECLLAELDQLSYSKKKGTPNPQSGNPKVRKMEEGQKSEDRPRGKGKPKEEEEMKKSPCRFFLSEGGCKKARSCPYGHVLDSEKRCWTCGSKEHFAGQCPRSEDTKPKAAKASMRSQDKERNSASSQAVKEEAKPEVQEDLEGPVEDTMKVLSTLEWGYQDAEDNGRRSGWEEDQIDSQGGCPAGTPEPAEVHASNPQALSIVQVVWSECQGPLGLGCNTPFEGSKEEWEGLASPDSERDFGWR